MGCYRHKLHGLVSGNSELAGDSDLAVVVSSSRGQEVEWRHRRDQGKNTVHEKKPMST